MIFKKFIGNYDSSCNGRFRFRCVSCESHLNLDIYFDSSNSALTDNVDGIYLIVCKKCRIYEGINDIKKTKNTKM